MQRPLDPDLTLEEIMRAWPVTITVFLRYRMLCVGCPIAAFHNISDACREHGVEEEPFMEELQAAIARAKGRKARGS